MLNNYINPQAYSQSRYPMINNSMNWVQGIEGGKAWQLTPNSNAVLFDSENDGIFYIKTSDSVGMCNLRRFKYEEITEQQTSKVDMSEYVRKSELQELLNSMLGGANEQIVSTDEHTIISSKQQHR